MQTEERRDRKTREDTDRLLARLDESSCVLPAHVESVAEPLQAIRADADALKAETDARCVGPTCPVDEAAPVPRRRRWLRWLIVVLTFGLAGHHSHG